MTHTLATRGMRKHVETVIERTSDMRAKRIRAIEVPLGFLAVRVDREAEQGNSVRHLTASGILFDEPEQTFTVFENDLWIPRKSKKTPSSEILEALVNNDEDKDKNIEPFHFSSFIKTYDYAPRPKTADDIRTYTYEHDELRTVRRTLRGLSWGHRRLDPLHNDNTTARDDLVSIMVAAGLDESAGGDTPAFPEELGMHLGEEVQAKLGSLVVQRHA